MKPVFGGFTAPEAGVHIARIKRVVWEDWKEDDKVKGRQCRLELKVEGGGSDGLQQSDWFYDPTKGDFSMSKLMGVGVKAGIFDENVELPVEAFRGDENEKKVEQKYTDRVLGVDIKMQKGKGKYEDRTIVHQYLTVKEAQALQKGNSPAGKPVPAPAPKEEKKADVSSW